MSRLQKTSEEQGLFKTLLSTDIEYLGLKLALQCFQVKNLKLILF
jgi:hypothetical protein